MTKLSPRDGRWVYGFAVLTVVLGFMSLAAVSAVETNGVAVLSTNTEVMSPALFRQIAALPGDAVPLVAPLAQLPYWTNCIASVELDYASGRFFKEEATVKTRSVQGRYLVAEAYSQFYHQSMSSIVEYDTHAAAYKIYGLYASSKGNDIVTVEVAHYDLTNKTYTATSAYGDGFQEKTAGTFTDTEDIAKAVVTKDGQYFLTRIVKTRPAEVK